MANKKRVNPRKRLATIADVNRAKNNATTEAIKRTIYMILYILIDKHDAPYEDIQILAEEIADAKIMLEQVSQIFNIKASVETWINYKIAKLERELEKK